MFSLNEKIKWFHKRINELQQKVELNIDVSKEYEKLKARIELFVLQVKLNKIQNERNSK